jgi:hypothetical protein
LFSRIEEVFNINSICFWQHLERNNLEEDVGVPHASSQDLEAQKNEDGDGECQDRHENNVGQDKVIKQLLDVLDDALHRFLL